MKITSDKARQQACTVEIINWLHHVWTLMGDDRLDSLQPDPFYPRGSKLDTTVVHNVLDNINKLFLSEFKKFYGYHKDAQGISVSQYLVPPKFMELPYRSQLAIVQEIDRICQNYRPTEEEVKVEQAKQAAAEALAQDRIAHPERYLYEDDLDMG